MVNLGMTKELFSFGVLFFVCLFGFVMQHTAIFYTDSSEAFGTTKKTFLNIFSAA
jgi:hypothetical protein